MKVFDLLKTRYTDYESQVKLFLSKTLANFNENYGNNTILGQLINVLGSTVQNVLLYIEDGLTESLSFIQTMNTKYLSMTKASSHHAA